MGFNPITGLFEDDDQAQSPIPFRDGYVAPPLADNSQMPASMNVASGPMSPSFGRMASPPPALQPNDPSESDDQLDLSVPGAAQEMNPLVKNYLMDKYSQDNRQKLEDDQKPGLGDRFAAGLAALGAGFQGKDAGQAGMSMLDKTAKEKHQALADFDRGRLADLDYKQRSADSDESKRFRSTLKANFPQIAAAYGDDFEKLTAADQKGIFQVAETKAKLDDAKARSELVAETSRNNAQMRRDAQNDSRSRRAEDDYQKYVSGKEKEAETLRGDDAAKMSSAKLSAISSGRALLDEYKGREDQMTPNQLSILAADRVKAVTGGVPGQDEMRHMMPHNSGTAWSGVKSYFTGSPEPAYSGGWVKEAAKDFDAQEKAARAILENRQRQITSNPRLRQEDRERIGRMAVPPEYINSRPAAPETVRMRDPKGIIRLVPKDQVLDAQKAGGTVVDDVAPMR